jgi:hypothetical protein
MFRTKLKKKNHKKASLVIEREKMDYIFNHKSYFENIKCLLYNIKYFEIVLLWDREAYDEYDECFINNLKEFCDILLEFPYSLVSDSINRIILVDKRNVNINITPGATYIAFGNCFEDMEYFKNNLIFKYAFKKQTSKGMSVWLVDNIIGKILYNEITECFRFQKSFN